MKTTTLAMVIFGLLTGCGDEQVNNNDLGGAADMTQMPSGDLSAPGDMTSAPQQRGVIIFVWDGMRPDSITAADTPNLLALKQHGVEFSDNHSTYPTFTMMNAASFATG